MTNLSGAHSPDAFDLGQVDPPSPEKKRQAALLAAQYALETSLEDPGTVLYEVLEALGMAPLTGPTTKYRLCRWCKIEKPPAAFPRQVGKGNLRTVVCEECKR